MLMELNHKALARFTRSNRVLTALEIESAEKVASGFMMIPPPSRCRLGQGLNLQLPSYDGRVFRSNRTLTATENFFWEKIRQGTNRSLPAQKRGDLGSPEALPARGFHRSLALVFASLTAEGNGD